MRRGLHGIKLVISDAHEGLKASIRRVVEVSWQRCRLHWRRNALSYDPKASQSMAAAALRQAFIQPDRASANQTLRHVANQLRGKWPKLAGLSTTVRPTYWRTWTFRSSAAPKSIAPTRSSA